MCVEGMAQSENHQQLNCKNSKLNDVVKFNSTQFELSRVCLIHGLVHEYCAFWFPGLDAFKGV